MPKIWTIFRKELIDTLRDRRTLLTMILVPLLLYPILFSVIGKISVSQVKKARQKTLNVALYTYGNAEAFGRMLRERDDVRVVEGVPRDSISAYIRADSLDGAFVFHERFDQQVADLKKGRVNFYFKSTDDGEIIKDRLQELLRTYEKTLLSERFAALELDESVVQTVDVVEVDVATPKERLGKAIGGVLPYIFVIFCFMGCMYPAVDLAAGEKERGTLETLLTSPVSRFQILVGKFGVVVLAGLISAAVSILGLYIGVRQVEEIPPELFDVIVSILAVDSIALLLTLLIPLTIFFAGVLLSLSIYARSFKEAQSIIGPVWIVVILPAAVAMVPGLTLDNITALVPILNVSLATKEILAGTADPLLLAETYISLIILAGLSLYGASLWFSREDIIFRA